MSDTLSSLRTVRDRALDFPGSVHLVVERRDKGGRLSTATSDVSAVDHHSIVFSSVRRKLRREQPPHANPANSVG